MLMFELRHGYGRTLKPEETGTKGFLTMQTKRSEMSLQVEKNDLIETYYPLSITLRTYSMEAVRLFTYSSQVLM